MDDGREMTDAGRWWALRGLGLIGFVLSSVYCSLFIDISLDWCCTYGYFTHFDIGFVLHNEAGFLILDT